MKIHFGLLIVLALALLAALSAAQADENAPEPAKLVDPGTLPEVQDVVFFTEKRPVLLRLRLYVDGKPASESWEAFQKKLFDYCDVDGNGFLDKDEAARVLPAQTLVQMGSGNFAALGQPVAPAFAELDLDKDGKISPAELAAYYRRYDAGPYVALTAPGTQTTATQLTDALFTAVDTDKDGKLSKLELQAAEQMLRKFDDNDDELISAQELLGTARDPYAAARLTQLARPGRKPPEASILLVPKEEGKNRIAQRLKMVKDILAHYDSDKNNKLSRAELELPQELFDRLDTNKDGELDAFELLRWLIATPDVDCTVRLGRFDKLKAIEANEVKGSGGLKLTETSPTTLALAFESSEVSLVSGAAPRRDGPRVFQAIRQLFKTLDVNKKGITRKQVEDPQYASLKWLFTFADQDGDDKLTEPELGSFLDLLSSGSGCQLSVAFTDNGQGLFDMLDANRDGQLGIRELRNAWPRLAAHDRKSVGSISRADLPWQYQLVIGAPGTQGVTQLNGVRMVDAPRLAPSQRGPLWFRKMDLNGDGDVSEREFLGSLADFRRLDLDGDGLISVDEAEKGAEWFGMK